MTHSTSIGTISGTVLSILITHTFISAAIVAAIGATVSFFCSLYLKWLISSDDDRKKIEFGFKRIFRKK